MTKTTNELVERLKYKGRVNLGSLLHRAGFYTRLLPVRLPNPKGMGRRLQAYLLHYYREVLSAEATLFIPELDVTFRCDLNDHMLKPYVDGEAPIYEIQEILYCKKNSRPGDVLFDIGANHGFWGFSVAHGSGPASEVHFFEPSPTLLKRLKHTSCLNPDVNAWIWEIALTNRADINIDFYTPRDNLSGLGSIHAHEYALQHNYLDKMRKVSVNATTLDRIVEVINPSKIDVIKIDVERAENEVIEGGIESIRKYRPRLIMCETNRQSRASSLLLASGYRCYRLDEKSKEVAIPEDSEFWGNIFFELV